jgi:hypothetical protein
MPTLAQSYAHLRPTGKLMVYGYHALLPKQGGRQLGILVLKLL